MTTNYHTPIATGAAANAATLNNPLEELDQALTSALLVERDGHIIQNEGVDLAQQIRLDFVGPAVNVTNGSGKTVVTIDPNINATEVAITGAISLTSTAISASLVALVWHYVAATSADYTIVLPTAVGYARKYLAFRIGIGSTKLVTLDGYSTETIDNSLTRIMWAGESCILYSDGANWFKVMGKTRPMQATQSAGAQQTGIVTSTTTLLTLGTSTIDNTGAMNDTANSRVYCRRPGSYRARGMVRFFPLTAAALSVMARLHKNGDAVNAIETSISSGSISANMSIEVTSEVVSLLAGDYLSLHTFQTSGANESSRYGTDTKNSLSLTEIPTW